MEVQLKPRRESSWTSLCPRAAHLWPARNGMFLGSEAKPGVQGSAREVLVPEGPLYRVAGTAISISCNVSGYEGPSQQDFEWFLYRPEAPEAALGIVSTRDTHFSYAVFGPRVAAGEVQVQRLQGDAVLLKIARLQAQDAGIYECYTPSTDARYLGSYSGKVELRVLPDALQVSAASPPGPRGRQAPASPPRLTVHEGQELALGCLARTSTQQHTHLAVSFGRAVPEAPVGRATLQEVVGLRPDLAVEAGAPYAERLAAGELRLAKEGAERYRMVVGGAQAEDAGTYHCTAAEWIQDPDGSWAQIAEKRAVLAHVDVQTLSSQLAVAVGPGERRIGPGEPLELLCNVSGALPPAGRHAAYSVGWEMAPAGAPGPGRLVAQLDTEGVGSLGPGYEGRHIAMEKVASRTYRLRLEAARPGDAGTYRCLAKAYVRGSGARLREAASARSRPLPVHVREEGVVLEAVAWLAGGTVYRGETASLLCNISVRGGPPGLRLAASWWVERPGDGELSPGPAQLVGGVAQDGVAELGVRPGGGPVSVELVGPRSHRLRLHGLGPEDGGVYHCAPSAWVQHADRSWYQAGSARSGPVTVYPYTHALDTLFVPLLVGAGVALVTGATVLGTITCCFMKRLRKR
ncbi:immunoglobulin superfamily member 8 isoform X1 [Canis lupus baileyi]|uniref:Immunoglobulin superfamily member 8 n=1 Tax=Canis lupus familiaris TaxID=9615 RepID=A0A8P0SUY4_CANLF|nr:immunoglobulin superfamily member 8 isoform X1 [Canis lupus dingo]XP_038320072.1 immunoglobulin superfamily member 8 isoform X1 [Canis lupus familiaris]XP_038442298.1 immunoglobulin superfamily member 8 isoform X1 [Canis lupus familiaris]